MTLDLRPLTPERWDDLVRLLGPRGPYAGCWCMWPRLTGAEFQAGQADHGAVNRERLRALVDAGEVPGLLAYEADQPVGWVAVGPKARYRRLDRSRVARPVDDRPAWSIVCLYVARTHRGRGVTARLIEGAVDWARRGGATLVEGYPIERDDARRLHADFAWWGFASAFRRAGFVEVARRTPTRPLMRRELAPEQ